MVFQEFVTPSDGQTPLRGAGDQYSGSRSHLLLPEEAKICPNMRVGGEGVVVWLISALNP